MRFLYLLFCIFITLSVHSQNSHVIVDKNGVMKWKDSKDEVKGFGVNYTVPFAHAFRSAQKMNVDIKKEMDNDIYHFSRLGFDLFRVHVWDTEISDTLGNLLVNEHLDHFDYLLKKLKDRGIRVVLTPIAFWGNGWPEPDAFTPGFSHKYGKGACLTHPDAIQAQQNYLYQFMNHVNPYTGLAYKDDPDIIAVEISNEPHHRGSAESVQKFVKGMVDAVKKSGTKKPIFYNISHSVHFAEAYFKGGIDGGTFQWYPTGLGYQRELPGNHLPNVADYNIPFDSVIKKYGGAKLVYEFDAADVGKGYIYPAIARSFRTAGIQIATHFSYDPSFLAPFNTEYNTHYMNLNYTPQKAIGLMISAEVFRNIPMYADFGKFPKHNEFGDFFIDPKKELALFNAKEKFYYTNTTNAQPKDVHNLMHIAGFGSSSLVQYDGSGAYFLDKLAEGVWRLEVQPDAAIIANPYGRNSLSKQVGTIIWNTNNMRVMLDDLGSDFTVAPINTGNRFQPEVKSQHFAIKPGTYVLTNKNTTVDLSSFKAHNGYPLNAFFAPETDLESDVLIHDNNSVIAANDDLTLNIKYISKTVPSKIEGMILKGRESKTIAFERNTAYGYSAIIPKELLTPGFLNYYVLVQKPDGTTTTYPADKTGEPFDWDFYDREPYQIKVNPIKTPITLFEASSEHSILIKPWRSTIRLQPLEELDQTAYFINLDALDIPDPENQNGTIHHDYTMKHFIGGKIRNNRSKLDSKTRLAIEGFALNDKSCRVQVALVMENGMAYGGIIALDTQLDTYELSLNDLESVKTVTLPRPYPTFLPYFLDHEMKAPFDLNRVEFLQLSIGPGLETSSFTEPNGIAVIKIQIK